MQTTTFDPISRFMSVALVEPEFPLNVGYVARVMANFGIDHLFIISETKFTSKFLSEAGRFASHGSHILKRAKRLESIEALRHKFRFLIGTTAIRGHRKSNLTRKTLGVEELAPKVVDLVDQRRTDEICIVLGRDTTGLTNAELQQCDFSVTIDTGTAYNTLNISHALAILLFIFKKTTDDVRRSDMKRSVEKKGNSNDSRKQRERVIQLFQQLAASSDFQKFKREKLRETLNRLIGRSDPSLRELYLLMGLASKANSKIERLSSISK